MRGLPPAAVCRNVNGQRFILPAFFLAFLLLFSVLQAGAQARDARAIAAAKNTSVHRIDPLLPDKPCEKWLREVAGPQARITWEVNDCGEQAGNPELDKGRDFPMCAEAQVTLQGKRKLSVAFSVGTFKTGVHTGSVRFAYAVVNGPGGPTRSIRKLSQVPEVIKATP
jgi:hypothetical protein